MPQPANQTDSAANPQEVRVEFDAMAVGRSVFGNPHRFTVPEVPGYGSLEFIAEGGLGRVWRARRSGDGLNVALKIPRETDPENVERLVVEAETLRGLSHSNIVALLEVAATSTGDPVLVMELVEGPSLTELLPDGGLEFDHALQVFLPVLAAVAHAHDQGIIHRDLKPSNILVAANGTPKVCDFGLAQPVQDRRLAFSMTRSGMLAGTVEYLAPECYEAGAEATRQTDIYALGIILYELFTGRPPRGDWRRLSEIKHLDVRLDDIFAEAIHPDPGLRLSSAERFKHRLEEIRDSRPRYAGTPLVTPAVRTADAVWTVGGLYFLAAGFCSQQRVNNTDVPALFDLTFGHTRMLGGFWAVWVMTLGMGVLWAWQAIRLWRFRQVPLREALPSPLGLKLGTSLGAAWLVALAQALCVWLPLVYILSLYVETWVWASPTTPFWEKSLAVTRWGSETPISPWTWDPRGFADAGRYWIREVQPGVTPGTWRLHDRQSFFVFTQPLLMSLGTAFIGAGMVATVAVVFIEWRRHHPSRRLMVLACLIGCGFLISAEVRYEWEDRDRDRADPKREALAKRIYAIEAALPVLNGVVQTVYDKNAGPREVPIDFFEPQVAVSSVGLLDRNDFVDKLKEERRHTHEAQRQVEAMHARVINVHGVGPWVTEIQFESYSQNPDGLCTGTYWRVTGEGKINELDASSQVCRWDPASTALYTSVARDLTEAEAEAWLAAFLAAFESPNGPELDSFFLPVVLMIEPSDIRQYLPGPRQKLVNALRRGLAGRPQTKIATAAPKPTLHRLTGGRWGLVCDLVEASARKSGSRVVSGTFIQWEIEVVFTSGNWQVLRIRM